MREPSELLLRYAECTDDEDSYDSAAEDEFYNGEDPYNSNPYKNRVFHKFSDLPPELRSKIWELGIGGRKEPHIFRFKLSPVTRMHPDEPNDAHNYPTNRDVVLYRHWTIRPGEGLAGETEMSRNIMATSREARAAALRVLPHTLLVRNNAGKDEGTVYFDRDRDIVHVSGFNRGYIHPSTFERRIEGGDYRLDGFAENVTQLAVPDDEFDERTEDAFAHFMQPLQSLRRLFLVSVNSTRSRTSDSFWCGSDYIHVHTSALFERRGEPFWIKHCWPNADDYDDYARNQVPSPNTQTLPHNALPLLSDRGIEIYPMVIFEGQIGLLAFKKLQTMWMRSYIEGIPIEELSNSESDDDEESEPDEYESEGIDDSEIEETDHENDDDGISGDEIFQGDGDDIFSNADAGEIHPVFSSPEPEPEPEKNGQDAAVPNPRKRRIVTDSDDEDASEGPGKKQARTSRSDTEDGHASRRSGAGRSRRRAAVVDSDDEADDDGGRGDVKGEKDEPELTSGKEEADEKQEQSNTHQIKEHEDDDDDDDDEEEEEDDEEEDDEEDEEPDVRRLSLAARLELARRKNPSPVGEGSDDEDSLEEDDDEEDEDDDEERSENDLIDGIAEESDDSRDY